MDREQAVKYLQSSGFSEEQIKAIEGAFTCDKCVYSTNEGCQYDDITEAIPPVTPQLKTRWIPVSESLPEIHQDVLLSLRSLDVEVGFRGSTEPYYYCHGGYIDPQNVLAWQPLPEPYKAEGSEKEVEE